jgi:chemotaxis signal transduction protein
MKYYLKFEIDNVALATPIQEIKEVARPKTLLQQKSTSKHLAGFFKLRGRNVPLFDLPQLFNSVRNGSFEVIVLEIDKLLLGFKVDTVFGILTADTMTPVPALARPKKFLEGIIQEGESIVQVLSLKKLMSGPRLRSMKKYM